MKRRVKTGWCEMRMVFCCCLLCWGWFPLLHAAETAEAPPATGGEFLRAAGRHALGDLTAGFYDSQRQRLSWIGPAILAGSGLAAGLAHPYLDDHFGASARTPRWPDTDDALAKVGLIAPLALPPALLLSALCLPRGGEARAQALSLAEQMIESLAFTGLTATSLKYGIDRRRPNGGGHAFPSAHTAFSFSSAGILLYDSPWYVGVPALALASLVGLARVDSKAHYASDVLAGAGIGFFFATAVHLYHRPEGEGGRPKSLVVLPTLSRGGAGLLVAVAY